MIDIFDYPYSVTHEDIDQAEIECYHTDEAARYSSRKSKVAQPPPPDPGSKKAIAAGCTCKRLTAENEDNFREWSYQIQGTFVINENCPIHGEKKEVKEK